VTSLLRVSLCVCFVRKQCWIGNNDGQDSKDDYSDLIRNNVCLFEDVVPVRYNKVPSSIGLWYRQNGKSRARIYGVIRVGILQHNQLRTKVLMLLKEMIT